MLARHVAAQPRLTDDRRKEPVSDLTVQEPFPALGKRRRVERLRVGSQIEEPFEQQAVVETLAEGPSERFKDNAINTVAFNNASGGTLRRPLAEYIASNSPSSSPSTS